jgi:hypothetical protein
MAKSELFIEKLRIQNSGDRRQETGDRRQRHAVSPRSKRYCDEVFSSGISTARLQTSDF